MYRNILVPLDRSQLAEEAIESAMAMAKSFNGKITLIHVLEILSLMPKDKESEYQSLKTKAQEYLSKISNRIEKSGISVETVIKIGNPSLVICEYARYQNIDIIVMTNSGANRVWFDRHEMGDVARKILNHSPKHVLMVRSVSDDLLKGRTILVVDDEKDILDTIEEMLDVCIVHKASNYDSAMEFIKKTRYDIAVLDIMGIDGFELLKETTLKGIPTVMLTAHAMTPESLTRAADLGAVSFLPKEKMSELKIFLEDILHGMGKPVWKKLFDRLSPYFRKRFGWTPDEEKDITTRIQKMDSM